ncbi:hypothetical protein VNO78_10115 [Psophocarpus tetragonolobus]|uniref:Uncharacterized protein n=1 Tax=Psophocarpus tetragonolobus TaxID=3891 RepID=A0AAN9SK47_PSOTE
MKSTSKVIVGATLLMVVTLAVVLVIMFVLLAELYCSLLLRRRHLRNSNSNSTIRSTTTQPATGRANVSPSHITSHPQQQSPPFRGICAQGVLQAPRSILLPAVSCKEDKAGPRKQKQKHYSELNQLLQIQIQSQESHSNASPSPPLSFISIAPSKPNHQHPLPGSILCNDDKPCRGEEHLVYISNPIYENDERQGSVSNTPFETPDTSPSRLERSCSSEEDDAPEATCSPPLTPMKKLPAKACSVSLRDARSLTTSCSGSRSNNGLSSSSGSPCTSPSW